MSITPSAMLVRCGARCNRNGTVMPLRARRSVSSGPFVGSDTVIPPVSPRFVFLPEPPQRAPIVKVQRKGTLPKPRRPLERTKDQVPWHLENTAPQATTVKTSKAVRSWHKDLAEWKAKEKDLRRSNFLEGYTALRLREGGQSVRPRRKPRETKEISSQMAPEPAYEEMSRPSILSYMNSKETWTTSRISQEEIEQRRARYAERQQAKEYERRTNLHTLYINAKNFIVNTEQLEQRLDEVYDSEFYEYNKDKDYGIWDEEGWPEHTTYLMERSQSYHGISAVEQTTGYTEIARKRIMKVTEEMTGGKLVHDSGRVAK